MKRAADLVKGSDRHNPFSDSQARNFSDAKIISEFCPTSTYWSLFNDQHEVLLGTRGSGKTFLLKMMRYSMLKRIGDDRAQDLATKKEFIALYVPMYLEFVTHLTSSNSSEENQVQLFQFAFNCLLAQSLIVEITEILSEEPNAINRALKNAAITTELNSVWFNDGGKDVSDLFSLKSKLNKLFYGFDVLSSDINRAPAVFKRQIGNSLLAVKELIAHQLNLSEEPTWIICIDEAEFLSEPLQRCINSVFRSDSKRIALKVATLPFYHKTIETLEPNISVSSGNDFNYRIVDLKFDSNDFINLTNSLCSSRLKSRFDPSIVVEKLEDFVGAYGRDDQIDYYREEVGVEASTYETIINGILSERSVKKKKIEDYRNPRKEVFDKFAPIFYVREMYKLSRCGNSKPGWYAGSQMIRKISQGNPRAFIQIMNKLFEKARASELTPKAQHGVIMDYVKEFCEATQALESNGPTMYSELKKIAEILHIHVHGKNIISSGSNFILKFDSDTSFCNAKKWLRQAIAYSRISINDDTPGKDINIDTEYLLANTYAAMYWIPMRADTSVKHINISGSQVLSYTVNIPNKKFIDSEQLSLFEEDET